MGLLNLLLGTTSNNFKDKYKIGDRVRIRYRGQEGYITDKNGSLYMVSIDNGKIVDSYEESELESCF